MTVVAVSAPTTVAVRANNTMSLSTFGPCKSLRGCSPKCWSHLQHFSGSTIDRNRFIHWQQPVKLILQILLSELSSHFGVQLPLLNYLLSLTPWKSSKLSFTIIYHHPHSVIVKKDTPLVVFFRFFETANGFLGAPPRSRPGSLHLPR